MEFNHNPKFFDNINDLQLREVEKAKIECARRHFSVISSDAVKYSAVSSYSELLTLVNK